MANYEHLPLPEYQGDLNKQKNKNRKFMYKFPEGRDKISFGQQNINKADEIVSSFTKLKNKYKDTIDVNLIYRIRINQSVDINSFDKNILSSMGMEILSVAENKKGYWVVFANEQDLKTFKEKLAQYSGLVQNGAKYDFFNAIDGIDDIPPEEKIGKALRDRPLTNDKAEYVNIELWRMDDPKLIKFIKELEQAYPNRQLFRITDKLITRSFALLRVRTIKSILDEILQLKEVAWVDRPFYPLFKPYEYSSIDISDIKINPPSEDAVGILIIDSGIVSNHPILEQAVAAEENYQDGEMEIQDTVGHGTAVSGCAIFGDIEECIKNKEFNATNWLFSAKVMYKNKEIPEEIPAQAIFDPEKLLEHQLHDLVKDFLDNPLYNIKVVNISFGNSDEIWDLTSNRQFPLASLIDELALDYPQVVFIVSAGNESPQNHYTALSEIIDNYPDYLVKNPHFRIINPATSALSLTVGSIAPPIKIMDDGHTHEDIWYPIAEVNQPSPFSRAGYGINGMIKPELVEYGGNLILKEMYGAIRENPGGKIALLSNNPYGEHIFTINYGTSFAAPKIANIAGKISNVFPHKSSNYIKNLILLSADYPDYSVLKDFGEDTIYRTEGYGRPNYEKAIYSSDNRVVLLNEDSIGLNKVKVFTVNIPDAFFNTKGYKKITVALTYNPPTRSTRGDSYLGNRLNFKLYHSIDPNELVKKFAEININEQVNDDIDDIDINEISQYEIKLEPGPNRRIVGCHQKAWKEFKQKPKKEICPPFSLVLINTNKWINDEHYSQDYCISLMLEHKEDIGLYNLIRNELRQRIRI
ncbi:MAG TPA: S8 family peptidase [Thermoanaerobacterales bacterium]|nr:S8 family peptidase [Thermoanaerobacterales bacterium]